VFSLLWHRRDPHGQRCPRVSRKAGAAAAPGVRHETTWSQIGITSGPRDDRSERVSGHFGRGAAGDCGLGV